MPDTQGLRGIAQDPFPHLAVQPKWLEDIKKIKKKHCTKLKYNEVRDHVSLTSITPTPSI